MLDEWYCDYCNKKFDSQSKAEKHEKSCKGTLLDQAHLEKQIKYTKDEIQNFKHSKYEGYSKDLAVIYCILFIAAILFIGWPALIIAIIGGIHISIANNTKDQAKIRIKQAERELENLEYQLSKIKKS
jgi:hypothetical protein